MEHITVRVCRASDGIDVELPRYMTDGSAGLDLRAAVEHEVVVCPGQRVLVPTGIHLEIPTGYEGQVRPRSGLALTSGLTVLNSPGTIDSDYRGELKVIMINLGDNEFVIERSMRIAQLVISPVVRAELSLCDKLDDSTRDEGGFGHTGCGMS